MPIKPKSQSERRSKNQQYWSNKQSDKQLSPSQQAAKKIRSSAKWQRVRKKKLSLNPLCEDPFKIHAPRGEAMAAKDVHHKIKIVDDPSSAFNLNNLMSVCKSCHVLLD